MKATKQKKCKSCGELFSPFNSMQKVCGGSCALTLVREEKAKESRKDLRERKQKLKTKAEWAREAQTVFNKYIRLRDAKDPCISCGRVNDGLHQRHASHYRSVGACKRLRYNELNVHASCAQCNSSKSGNIVDYRIGLIVKIGTEKVEWLESQNEPKRYTEEDLKQIKKDYQKKIKEFFTM